MSVSQFSIVSSLNPFHLRTIPGNFKHYSSKSDRTVSLVRFCDDSHRSFDKRLRNDVSGICFCKSSEESDVDCSDKPTKINLWPILQPWDVPWDWKVAVFVMLPYVMRDNRIRRVVKDTSASFGGSASTNAEHG